MPVSLDGKALDGPDLIARLSALAAAYGLGRNIHVGETALGIKGRIGFEAGAALLLIAAHRELEKLVLTKWQIFWKDQLGRFYGDRLHEGHYFDPALRDIEALFTSSQQRVTGETRVRLAPGRFMVTGARSPYSMMDRSVATYGEENRLWTGDEARAFARIGAIPELLAMRAPGLVAVARTPPLPVVVHDPAPARPDRLLDPQREARHRRDRRRRDRGPGGLRPRGAHPGRQVHLQHGRGSVRAHGVAARRRRARRHAGLPAGASRLRRRGAREIAVGDVINVLNLGGILGRCTSVNPDIGPPFKAEVLGAVLAFPALGDRIGRPAHDRRRRDPAGRYPRLQLSRWSTWPAPA